MFLRPLKSFMVGAMAGGLLVSLALANVPQGVQVTDDSELYEQLTEIRVPKQGNLNFDGDIARLAALEGRYPERVHAQKKRQVAKRQFVNRVKPAARALKPRAKFKRKAAASKPQARAAAGRRRS